MSSLPNLPPPFKPALANRADRIPRGDAWQYEPKWDGLRAIAFHDGSQVFLQSRRGYSLNRHFPDLVAAFRLQFSKPVILDGELVIATERGCDFDRLMDRMNMSDTAAAEASRELPAGVMAFDVLAYDGEDLRELTLAERRRTLEKLLPEEAPVALSPATTDRALAAIWLSDAKRLGFEGVVSKRLDEPYRSGERPWLKTKARSTVDCVVAGLEWSEHEKQPPALLLGLYDDDGTPHDVGSVPTADGRALQRLIRLVTPETVGFGGGRMPGDWTRLQQGREIEWVRLRPELVCEVSCEHLGQEGFRHGARFERWRLDKLADQCTLAQTDPRVGATGSNAV